MSVIKCYYRRNLKMSDAKLAAQVGHVVSYLSVKHSFTPDKIVVLKASDVAFDEYKELYGDEAYVQKDLGLTEIYKGTETVIGWWEK